MYKPMNCGGPEAVLKGMSRSTAEFSHNTARLTCDELALLLAHKEELLLHIHGRGVALADGDPTLDARFELASHGSHQFQHPLLFFSSKREERRKPDRVVEDSTGKILDTLRHGGAEEGNSPITGGTGRQDVIHLVLKDILLEPVSLLQHQPIHIFLGVVRV